MAVPISSQQKALIALLRAAGRVRRGFAGALDAHGLTASQYNVLRILRGAGGELAIMTIRDRMMDPEPSITRLVDRLEERGLVARHRSPEDRRRVDCKLTAEGLRLVASLDEPVDAVDQKLMEGLSESELETLTTLLARVAPTK
ncbi:MAG: MarR family transcriptional regulator [Gemmatimonadetes bacterium]|nr:MarR family transcriptional regulator [Gemmatimonadota bacterium]